MGLSIGIMVFILYTPYFLSPYINPTPNLHLTGNFLHFHFLKKTNSVLFISVLKYGDMGQCPHKSHSTCNTYVIPHTHTHTHTTHTHTHTHAQTHAHTHAQTHAHTHAHTHTHTHTHSKNYKMYTFCITGINYISKSIHIKKNLIFKYLNLWTFEL